MCVQRRITVDGVTLACTECGQGEAIVFLHGIAASSYSWRAVATALSGDYRTLCFDLMGFGDSDKPRRESYTLRRQAELIRLSIRELGLQRVILIGHSMGGGVCLSLMQDDPDIIAGLILVDTACYMQRLPISITLLRIPVLPKLAMAVLPSRWLYLSPLGSRFRTGVPREALAEYARCLDTPGAHAALIATAEGIVPRDLTDFTGSFSRIHVPTQIIWGERDWIIPLDMGRRLADEIPGARLDIVPNAGHCPHEQYPEQTTVIVRRFLQGSRE